MRKKLYVGNLSLETTETELKELFTQSGLVETVRIITDRDTGRSKGFGFVEMQEGGDKAMAEMNGKDFNGRALTVNEARPMTSRDFRDRSLSGTATVEEVEFLKRLRFRNGRQPTALYYYRELQNLRNPLHFRRSSHANVQTRDTMDVVVRWTDL